MPSEPGGTTPAEVALRSGEWTRARDDFLAVVAEHPRASAYEGLAQALWWLDDGAGCLEAREAPYRIYRTTDRDVVGAARAATALAYDALLFGAGVAVARGWWGRARDLLDAIPERAEHGWLAVREAELALAIEQDAEAARAAGDRAWAVGRSWGTSIWSSSGWPSADWPPPVRVTPDPVCPDWIRRSPPPPPATSAT